MVLPQRRGDKRRKTSRPRSSVEERGRGAVSTRRAPEGTRTPNLLIRSQMLYPLSYGRSTAPRRGPSVAGVAVRLPGPSGVAPPERRVPHGQDDGGLRGEHREAR